jgi:hypothetical protein
MEELFDDPEVESFIFRDSGTARIKRGPSTPETRARWAEIKRHRIGSTWYEGDTLYRRASLGVTAFNVFRLGSDR